MGFVHPLFMKNLEKMLEKVKDFFREKIVIKGPVTFDGSKFRSSDLAEQIKELRQK